MSQLASPLAPIVSTSAHTSTAGRPTSSHGSPGNATAASPRLSAERWPPSSRRDKALGVGRPTKRENTTPTKSQKARVQRARGNPRWTELDEADLVPRDDLLVSVETDAIYKRAALQQKTPPERGFSARADDGIRTHDLLHGKQTL